MEIPAPEGVSYRRAFANLNYMPNVLQWKLALIFAASFSLAAPCLQAQHSAAAKPAKSEPKPEESVLSREIRHQILVLPYYSVFDYVSFSLDGDKVTLNGQVLRPTLRADAEAAIKSIEGVASVNNLIENLPRSATDDDIRRGVYRAMYEDSTLQRYGIPDVPAIHILVKNGQVTLEGAVGSEPEKTLAAARASSVAGISGVKNNLVIHPKSPPAN
jgi:hyperosmotically inducible periplasmic protein